MVATLPLEVLQIASQQCPYRDAQIRDVAALHSPNLPPPPTTVAYGLEGTGKLEVISAVLEARSLCHATIKCRECLSQRHLLGKMFAACARGTSQEETLEQYDRVDSLNALSVNLQRLFGNTQQKMVLVLDAIDELKGAGSTMLPALARLGDMIPGLSIILATASMRPLPLHRPGVPHVYFPVYTRSQAVHVQCKSMPDVPDSLHSSLDTEELALVYKQFTITVYDSLIAPTSTSLDTFRKVCSRLWPQFIWPAVSGEQPVGKAKKWDFPRLLVKGRSLFHSEGESALLDTLQSTDQAWTFADLIQQKKLADQRHEHSESLSSYARASSRPSQLRTERDTSNGTSSSEPAQKPLLGSLATLLLLSAHLSSHTPAKHDILLFSRLSAASSKHRKIRYIKRGNPTAGGTPKKAMEDGRRKDKTKSLAPKTFSMERLLAIARAVHPEGVGTQVGHGRGRGGEGWSDQVARALGELERMRLVRREDDGHEDGGGVKWRVNVGREVVAELAATHGLGVQEWELEL